MRSTNHISGCFLAKISRGRTVREFICATLVAPVIVTFVWVSVMGGGAILTERYAQRQVDNAMAINSYGENIRQNST